MPLPRAVPAAMPLPRAVPAAMPLPRAVPARLPPASTEAVAPGVFMRMTHGTNPHNVPRS
jgi:hypothetical protein